MKKITFTILAACIVSACGGSGGGAIDGIDTGSAEFDELVTAAVVDFKRFETFQNDEGQTPYSQVAVQAGIDGGTVTYEGYASVIDGRITGTGVSSFVNERAAIGTVTATADFAGMNPQITGRAEDFFEVSNPAELERDLSNIGVVQTSGPVAGSFGFTLDVNDGLGNFAVLPGQATGGVTFSDTTEVTFTDLTVGGEFYGDELDAFDAFRSVQGVDDFTDIGIYGFK